MTVRVIPRADLRQLVGQPLGTSGWTVIGQTRVTDFGILTEDEQWLHSDIARAEREMNGTIAHGFLTLAMLSKLRAEIWEIERTTRAFNYGFNKLRFPAPVPTGAAIRLHETLLAVEERGTGVMLTRDIVVEVRGAAKPAVAAEWLGLIYFD